MVAKDYPFYLTVKRANCNLEVPPASGLAKDAEVGRALHLDLSGSICLPFSLLLSHSLGALPLSVSLPISRCRSLSVSHTLCLSIPMAISYTVSLLTAAL